MKQKVLASASDVILVVLLVGGAAWLFASGSPPAGWVSDGAMLPLSVDGSRLVIALLAAGVALGLVFGLVLPRRRDRFVGGHATRYDAFERLSHWAMALGYVLAFGTAVSMLGWLALRVGAESRPTLYQLHFAGAALIVLSGALFTVTARVQGKDALFPRWRDVSPAVARLFSYLGVYGHPGVLGVRLPGSWQTAAQRFLRGLGVAPLSREDKFLSVEKVFSFTPLAVLTLVVVATGLVKTARYFFAVPVDVYAAATWLHDLSTWLTLFVVGAHLAAIFLVPRNWHGIRAMASGRMSRTVVEHEFPAWAERLAGGEAEPTPVVRSGVAGTIRR